MYLRCNLGKYKITNVKFSICSMLITKQFQLLVHQFYNIDPLTPQEPPSYWPLSLARTKTAANQSNIVSTHLSNVYKFTQLSFSNDFILLGLFTSLLFVVLLCYGVELNPPSGSNFIFTKSTTRVNQNLTSS